MSKLSPQQPVQDLNILGSVLESVQIGGIAGRDLNLTQIQGGVGALNVFGTVQVAQASLSGATSISQEEYRRRAVLLNRVKKDWVEGVLKGSLHNKAVIELDLEERKDLVQSPLSEVEEFPVDSRKVFSEGTSATDIFEEIGAGRTLLILGEPGAGKTVTLLKLAESLIARTENDLSQPLPVVMNLSSWAKSRKPIISWLVQELSDKYHVSKPLGKAWVEQEQLILLLDGLDEVDAQYRDDCVKALNQFIQEYGLTEIVICSRIQDYKNLSEHLKLRSAIYVQPLKAEQINQFLEQVGEPLFALKTVLQNNTELQAFASSPLILSIMSLAYRNYSAEVLTQSKTLEDQRKHLFDIYIERMFARRGTTQKYSRETTLHWLNWLAKQMVQSSQTMFLIERLQPSCLPSQTQRVSYRLASHLLTGLILALITVSIITVSVIVPSFLIDGFKNGFSIKFDLSGMNGFLHGTFIFGLFYISSIVAIDLLLIWPFVRGSELINPAESLKWSWEKSRQFATAGILSGALIGFIGGLVVGVLWAFDFGYVDIPRLEIKSLELTEGLFLTLVVGLIFSGTFRLFFGTRDNTIYAFPKERTGWFWKTTRFALILGLVLGILLTLGSFLNYRATLALFEGILAGNILGLILGLIIALILGLISEVRRPRVSEINNISETEKMFSWSWREGRRIIFSGILVGVFIGVLGGLIWGSFLIFVYPEQMPDSSKLNLFEPLFIGLFYGVIFGGCLSLIFRLADTMIHIPALWKESWSWKNARVGLILGLVFGLFLGIALFFYPEPTFMVIIGIVSGIVLGIVLGLIMAPITGLIGGFRASGVSKSNFPNQGIWKSLKSYSIFGVTFGILLGLIHGSLIQPNSFFTATFEFDHLLTHRLVESVCVGLSIYGPICGLFAGGLACFKHLTLRLMLTCQGSTPWNYAQFLDYAVDRFFMQKVGGGYIFVHRMLLEHFAEMELRSK